MMAGMEAVLRILNVLTLRDRSLAVNVLKDSLAIKQLAVTHTPERVPTEPYVMETPSVSSEEGIHVINAGARLALLEMGERVVSIAI